MIFLPLFMMLMPVPPADPAAAPPLSPSAAAGPATVSFSRTSAIEPKIAVRIVHRSGEHGAPVYVFQRIDEPRPGIAEAAGPPLHAATSSCPGSGVAVAALEKVALPAPDLPGLGAEVSMAIADGPVYRLDAPALHGDGQAGSLSVSSGPGAPLADWIDRMLAVLEPCWSGGERG